MSIPTWLLFDTRHATGNIDIVMALSWYDSTRGPPKKKGHYTHKLKSMCTCVCRFECIRSQKGTRERGSAKYKSLLDSYLFF